eukprot:UC1_evm4s2112
MTETDQVIVVTVLKGREFPRRAHFSLVVQGKFDGEELSADPVRHDGQFEVQNELAWVVSRRALHQHRMQRTPVKLTVYAVDHSSYEKVAIGYVMLSLRTAQQTPPAAKWYKVLNCLYKKSRPELQVMIAMEDAAAVPAVKTTENAQMMGMQKQEKEEGLEGEVEGAEETETSESSELETFTEAAAGALSEWMTTQKQEQEPADASIAGAATTTADGTATTTEPYAVLTSEGIFQIGGGASLYSLGVTVSGAADLTSLAAPSRMPPPGPLTFRYHLFGNVITTESFNDLAVPAFATERAEVRIRSSASELAAYFRANAAMHVELVAGTETFGVAQIRLDDLTLIAASSMRAVDGAFPLLPVGTPAPSDSGDHPNATVKVAVTLRQLEDASLDASAVLSRSVASRIEEARSPARSAATTATGQGGAAPSPLRAVTYAEDLSRATGDTVGAQSSSGTGIEEAAAPAIQVESHNNNNIGQPSPPPAIPEQHEQQPYVPSLTRDPRRFAVSVDTRTIRHLNAGVSTANVYVRYSYPFFGSAVPVVSHPPVAVPRHSEKLLPASFTAFEFTSTRVDVFRQFSDDPVRVELLQTDPYAKDRRLGVADLPVGQLMRNEPVRTRDGAVVHTIDAYVPVLDLSGESAKRVAELRVLLTLEDLGLSDDAPMPTTAAAHAAAEAPSSDSAQTYIAGGDGSGGVTAARARPVPVPVPVDTNSPEYKAALELEMWKRVEQEKFQQALNAKEALLMKALSDEFRSRDKAREAAAARKAEEYSALERELQATVKEVEVRERKLGAAEEELRRQRKDHKADFTRQLGDIRDASRRMQKDYSHQVEVEQARVDDLRRRVTTLADDKATVEKRYRRLEEEFVAYRHAQAASPEGQLREKVATLEAEANELRKSLDATKRAKGRYKSQWSRALHALAKLKQKTALADGERLRREAAQLDQLRLHYLAREERDLMQQEKSELCDLRQGLGQLRKAALDPLSSGAAAAAAVTSTGAAPPTTSAATAGDTLISASMEDADRQALRRLMQERKTLLDSGVYAPGDIIVTELERRIERLMPQPTA